MPFRAITATMALAGSTIAMAAPKIHVLTEADASRTVAIERGRSAYLELESNPSTGYAWFVLEERNAKVIQPIRTRAHEHRTPILGAPETATIRITFRDAGTASVTLGYRRSFEPKSKPVKILRYVFKVA